MCLLNRKKTIQPYVEVQLYKHSHFQHRIKRRKPVEDLLLLFAENISIMLQELFEQLFV
jgi:hypothetical protein